ncbi:MAG: amino acid ABC transporter permease [Promethearchaeota archaeon]
MTFNKEKPENNNEIMLTDPPEVILASDEHQSKKNIFGMLLRNFGWIFLGIFIFFILMGVVQTWFDESANYIDPIAAIINAIISPFGGSIYAENNFLLYVLRGLANGLVLTVIISLISVLAGFFLAMVFAVLLVNNQRLRHFEWDFKSIITRFFGFIAQIYVDFFRSTPLLVQILMVYFGFQQIEDMSTIVGDLGVNFEVFCGTIALTINTAAYQAEIIRGGILSIPAGQTEASRALGLTSQQTMRYVILPQAIRMIVPPLTNELINVLLNSSLVSAIGALDLTKRSRSLSSHYFRWEVFFIAAVYYFIVAYTLSKLTKRLEVKYRIPGLGVAND